MSTSKPFFTFFEASFLGTTDPPLKPVVVLAPDWWKARVQFASFVPEASGPEDVRILVAPTSPPPGVLDDSLFASAVGLKASRAARRWLSALRRAGRSLPRKKKKGTR